MKKLLKALFLVAGMIFSGMLLGHAQVSNAPLSSMVAVSMQDDLGTGEADIASYVKALVAQYNDGSLTTQFPLANVSTDTVRALEGLQHNVVISWLEPLTWDDGSEALRYGATNDYIAYFGDGWDTEEGAAPQFNGAADKAWVWVNHEYVSGDRPTATSAAIGEHATLVNFLSGMGIVSTDGDTWSEEDLATYTKQYKKQVGGSWFRIVQDPASGNWLVERNDGNTRFDATSNTLATVTGIELSSTATTDTGEELPAGVVPGIMGDCSGGQTPWGTVITAEENVQSYYGDLEAAWTSSQQFVLGQGFDPGSVITFDATPSEGSEFYQNLNPDALQNRDYYGYLTEIDPTVAPNVAYDAAEGVGHRKLGALGRARWENATFAVQADFTLIPDQPIVVYAGNDRRGGRLYKLVSKEVYTPDMSRAEIRALLDEGTVYVAHFAGLDNTTGYSLLDGDLPTVDNRGEGQWLELSLTSTDIAPNAEALGMPDTTIGEALQDVNWNGIGGFESDNMVRMALFTAANKTGVMETNRPEDVEWNPSDVSGTPRLYVAFTNHTRQTALNQDGVLYDPSIHAEQSIKRDDATGSIMALEEADPAAPGSSKTFSYFVAWKGSQGQGDFDAAAPDNIMIDKDGGVWFGTDGNFGRSGTADGVYYLDTDSQSPSYGKPFRIAAAPSNAEATGPAFNSEMSTVFFNVQHPGEGIFSNWPSASR